MHTYEYCGVIFNCNSDLSGEVRIISTDGPELWVPGAALVAFVAGFVARQKIAALEQAKPAEVLGIPWP